MQNLYFINIYTKLTSITLIKTHTWLKFVQKVLNTSIKYPFIQVIEHIYMGMNLFLNKCSKTVHFYFTDHLVKQTSETDFMY